MDVDKIKNIIENVSDKPNKDLFEVESLLFNEYNSLKEEIISLTFKLEKIEELYNIVTNEIKKRKLR